MASPKMYNFKGLKSDADQKVNRTLNMIKLFFQNKDYETAKKYIYELLEVKPDSSQAYKYLSLINETLGEYDLAMKHYQKCLDLKTATELNCSGENNYYQFTPNKFSSPRAQKNNNLESTQENSLTDLNIINNIEQLFEKKFTTFVSELDSIKHHLAQLEQGHKFSQPQGNTVDQKSFFELQNKINILVNKQDEMLNKLYSMPILKQPPPPPQQQQQQQDDKLAKRLNVLEKQINCLREDNGKIFENLEQLKISVQSIADNQYDHDDDDDYDQEDDDDDDTQNYASGPTVDKPKLYELFKPSQNTWECDVCAVVNDNSSAACESCENPNPNTPKMPVQGNGSGGSQSAFKFGASAPTFSFQTLPDTKPQLPLPTPPGTSPFGIKGNSSPLMSNFGSSLTNNGDKPSSLFGQVPNTFVGTSPSFGVKVDNASSISSLAPAPSVATFGSNQVKPSSLFSQGPVNAASTSVGSSFTPSNSLNNNITFGGQMVFGKSTSATSAPFGQFSFGNKVSDTNNASFNSGQASSFSFSLKPATTGETDKQNTSTSNTNTASTFTFHSGASSNSTFSPSSNSLFGNSPVNVSASLPMNKNTFTTSINESNNTNHAVNNEHKEEEHVSEDDTVNAFKLPDVKLPETYDVITGEEDETVIYEQKAKLLLFKETEYKERGVGILKILQNKQNLKYRLLMRRDQTLKVCLNTQLASMNNMELLPKYVRFTCIDFSDEKPSTAVYLLKLPNPETKLKKFKELVDSLKAGTYSLQDKNDVTTNEHANTVPLASNNQTSKKPLTDLNTDPDIELVFIREPKPEHMDKISKLRLPVNFYDYEDKKPCKGCIGCRVDELDWNQLTVDVVAPPTTESEQGLFSSTAVDLNVTEYKVDTIGSHDNVDNDQTNDTSFVSEKSKLLPQNFVVLTGEEGEKILFNERAYLYHYVDDQWKQRGIGSMKILRQPETGTCRLLMRRDKIYNVICNHTISSRLDLKPFNNSSNSLTWFERDYSEDANGEDKLFALKFKTENLVNQFKECVQQCIEQNNS